MRLRGIPQLSAPFKQAILRAYFPPTTHLNKGRSYVTKHEAALRRKTPCIRRRNRPREDFYFDDQKWVVRYAVVDTGSWLLGRLVLIAPHAFGNLDQNRTSLLVNLTRQQIENSPPIESHKPVSRQYEEEYYRYYGWPSYWMGEGIWGLNASPVASPIFPPPPSPLPIWNWLYPLPF